MTKNYIKINKENTIFLLDKKSSVKKYKILESRRYEPQFKLLNSLVNINSAILDVGVREGAFLKFLKTKGFNNLFGVDVLERSIDLLKKAGINGSIMNAQEDDLERSFDFIVLSHILEHCPKPQDVIFNMYKHLNMNGFLLVEVPKEKKKPTPTPWAHFYCFENMKDLLSFFDYRWKIIEKGMDGNNIRILVRKIK